METDTLTAGAELDRRVCEALGWTDCDEISGRAPADWGPWPGDLQPYPGVSTDAGEAWRLLVPALNARGLYVNVQQRSEGWDVFVYEAEGGLDRACVPESPTPEVGLCLAALAAVAGRGEGEAPG